jgi:GxxExxY protein
LFESIITIFTKEKKMMEKYDGKNYLYTDLTREIIGAFYTVYSNLGFGFLEKVYHNAMLIELKKLGLKFESEQSIKVYYDGIIVGDYNADIIVDQKVIVELKAVSKLNQKHEVQLVNYLKGTGIPVGLLLNFGEEPGQRRKVLSPKY